MKIRSLAAGWALVAALAAAGPLVAQEQVPTDVEAPPTPADTTAVVPAPDSTTAQDSIITDSTVTSGDTTVVREPPPRFIQFPETGEAGWIDGVWSWSRDELLGSGVLTLTELLSRVPGITPVRSAILGQPEGASAFGLAGGRVEVVWDGFVLDPIGSATLDLSAVELVQLERVRVERRLDRLRIELYTLAPSDARAYSIVEAGTGHYDTNMFRGLFLTPRFLGGPFSFGIERLETDGNFNPAPTSSVAAWVKWGVGPLARNVQIEVRRTSGERGSGTPAPGDGSRLDWALRARAQPLPVLTAEAYIGQSIVKDGYALGAQPGGPGEGDDVPDPSDPKQSSWQAGVRASVEPGPVRIGGGLRFRNHEWLPSLDAEASAGFDLAGLLFASGEVRNESWRDAGSATSYGARVHTRPVLGFRGVAEWVTGKRGVSPSRDVFLPVDTLIEAIDELDEDTTVVWDRQGVRFTDRTAWRVGGEFSQWGIQLGASMIGIRGDSAATFGLEFDRVPASVVARPARGWELTARLPLLLKPLHVEAVWTRWDDVSGWLYLPAESFRASLVYHHLPLPSGNLEFTARIDHVERGEMIVPGPDGTLAVVPSTRQLDGYLQIRIMDVRAFMRWDNMLNIAGNADLPGRVLPGQRVFYGVKWNFWD